MLPMNLSVISCSGLISRRQVLWIAKQILQLGMGDAIDDWLLGRIQWLRREEVVASGIHWVKDVSPCLSTLNPT